MSGGGDSPQRFKAAARRFASGVTVVTTSADGRVHGITASSFAALSLDPLLVTVAVDARSRLLDLVEQAGHFAISVLGRDQHELSRHFATPNREPATGGFDVAPSYRAATGSPILAGAIAYFDCSLHSMMPGGDHRILVGRVLAAGESGGEPLLYFEGDYHELGTPRPARGTPRARPEDPDATTRIPESDLLAVQRAVEPTIAELAAVVADEDDLTRLRALLHAAEESIEDPIAFTALGVEFHVALADACANRSLRALAASLREEQTVVYERGTDIARARAVLEAHRAILSCVERRDPEAARAAALDHVEDIGRHVSGSAPSGTGHGGRTAMGRTSIPASTAGSIANPT